MVAAQPAGAYVQRLGRKLANAANNASGSGNDTKCSKRASIIVTEWGGGYRLAVDVTEVS